MSNSTGVFSIKHLRIESLKKPLQLTSPNIHTHTRRRGVWVSREDDVIGGKKCCAGSSDAVYHCLKLVHKGKYPAQCCCYALKFLFHLTIWRSKVKEAEPIVNVNWVMLKNGALLMLLLMFPNGQWDIYKVVFYDILLTCNYVCICSSVVSQDPSLQNLTTAPPPKKWKQKQSEAILVSFGLYLFWFIQ